MKPNFTFTYFTFTLRTLNWALTLLLRPYAKNITIPSKDDVKYLTLHLDKNLT